MKKYIKPNVLIVRVKVEKLLQQYSVTSVKGLEGVTKGGVFDGGVVNADSRRNSYWDDEEDEFDF